MTDGGRAGGAAAPAPVPVGLGKIALHGLCPRCGARTLFAGPVAFEEKCSACGLDFSGFNVGDGPAAFLTLILGTIVVALAIALQLTWQPPLWLQMAIWIPFTAAGVVLLLRVAKAVLLALEYRGLARTEQSAPPE